MAEKEVKSIGSVKDVRKEMNRGAWTAEEDRKLAEVIEVHGAKRWKMIATTAGLFVYDATEMKPISIMLYPVLTLMGFWFFFCRFESVWEELQASMDELSKTQHQERQHIRPGRGLDTQASQTLGKQVVNLKQFWFMYLF